MDVADWAEHFNLAASTIDQFVLADAEKDILTFRVRFASGHRVTALSSRPSNLRSKKGVVRIDEAAFHEDLGELLKAAKAILMWGGRVIVWSTHNGIDNLFNEMVKDVESGISKHKITLSDAIADGLYKRICLVNNQEWSSNAEQEWVDGLYRAYGPAASEELDCIPWEAKAGSVFDRTWFKPCEAYPLHGSDP